MTTQSTLQYSFTFTQSHTHSYSASIGSTLLFYEAQFGVQHLAQRYFGMQICPSLSGGTSIEKKGDDAYVTELVRLNLLSSGLMFNSK